MNNQDQYIFELYKPFRNKLKKFNLNDSLHLIWGYSRNYTFNFDLPTDIEYSNGFNPLEPDLNKRKIYGIYDHELEFLLKEFILNCEPTSTIDSLKKKIHFAPLINYLRGTLSEEIDKKHALKVNIFYEFNRLAHRQFQWQLNHDNESILRYYKIYSNKDISVIIQEKFQLTPHQLFLTGILFFIMSGTSFTIDLPLKSTSPIITDEMIQLFLNHFSIDIKAAKEALKNNQQMNENLFYSFNPLFATPLLSINNQLICPIPKLIFWLFTNGIYYCIDKDDKNFAKGYGNAFQEYIGDVIQKICDNKIFDIFPEEIYGKEQKRTSDWIITDKDSILFIECKTKRMTLNSKTYLDSSKGLENDLQKMSSFILQLYKTYLDYEKNLYPTIEFDNNKNFYPLILTLENWYINYNPVILDKLNDYIIKLFKDNNMDLSLLDKFPYNIRCSSEFEVDIQLINALGIKDYFNMTINNQIQEFKDKFEFINIYEGDYEKLFIDPLKPHL